MADGLVVVSNKGPLTFGLEAGRLRHRRGAGGLVTAVGPAVDESNALWVAGASSEADRAAANQNDNGVFRDGNLRLKLVDLDPDQYRAYYDVVSNSVLWYVYHGLFDPVRRPLFDRRFRDAWTAYREVNNAFAQCVIEQADEGAVILVQDYHLSLVGVRLAKERPDLRTVHFHHTPFCEPDRFGMLPDDIAVELMDGLGAFRACGFHTQRWADNFVASSQAVVGRAPSVFISPATPDVQELDDVTGSDAFVEAREKLESTIGDRKFIVRVDRLELSKNILRGFHAFDELLATVPEWRGEVVFGAYVYPSRIGLADYLGYRNEVENLIERINRRWARPGWTPILVNAEDDFPTSIAALSRYDALLVNPIRDGLNLVAKEGAYVNRRDGALVLSRESGVWDELGQWAYGINPFDVSGTAEALDIALRASAAERAERAAGLRAVATDRSSTEWLGDQVAAAS